MSEVFDDFCADRNFNRLDGGKQQSPKTFVKIIRAYNIGNALPKNILGSEKITAMDCATLRASPEPVFQLKLLVDIAACTRF